MTGAFARSSRFTASNRFGAKCFQAVCWIALGLSAALSSRSASLETASHVGEDGVTAGTGAFASAFTRDSRHLLFLSTANNLVTNDDRGPWMDVFLHSLDSHATVLVSVNRTGVGGGNGNSSSPAGSADGRYIAFLSDASDLTADPIPGGSTQVFVRDTQLGTTRLVSTTPQGFGGNGPCGPPRISDDGRLVVFESDANDLVSSDANNARDVFVRDLAEASPRLVSVAQDGVSSGGAASDSPQISSDGRTIVFRSAARDLVASPQGGLATTEIYLRDLGDPVAQLISNPPFNDGTDNPPLRDPASEPTVSRSGRYVAYKVLGRGFRASPAVVLHDRSQVNRFWVQRWEPGIAQLTRSPLVVTDEGPTLICEVSILFQFLGFFDYLTLRLQPSEGAACPSSQLGEIPVDHFLVRSVPLPSNPPYEFGCFARQALAGLVDANIRTNGINPSVSEDGKTILLKVGLWKYFRGNAQLTTDPVPPGADASSELQEGARIFEFPPFAQSFIPFYASPESLTLSSDGKWVAFDSTLPSAKELDRNAASDVFLFSRSAQTTQLVSRRVPELSSHRDWESPLLHSQAVDWEGTRFVFAGLWPIRPAVFPLDPSYRDFFVSDLASGGTLPVTGYDLAVADPPSPASSRYQTNAAVLARISSSGRYLVSLSESVGRPPGRLLYCSDLESRTRQLVYAGANGIDLPTEMLPAWSMSADAEIIAYDTTRSGIVPEDLDSVSDVYVWRRSNPALPLRVSKPLPGMSAGMRGDSFNPSVSPDGRWVVFTSRARDLMERAFGDLAPRVFLRDLNQERTFLLLGAIASAALEVQETVWSGDSRFLGLCTQDKVCRIFNVESQTSQIVPGEFTDLQLSRDGRYLAAVVTPPELGWRGSQVVRIDLQSGVSNVVSVAREGVTPGDGPSRHPQITPDGSRVFFSSEASDLVMDDDNARTDIFIRDFTTGTTTLLSRSPLSGHAGNGASSRPWLSGNGQVVFFTSVASDLITNDFNGREDLFQVRFDEWDSDHDGLPDAWERRYFGGLARAAADSDSDGDGVSDFVEWSDGTNPVDPFSGFRLKSLNYDSGSGAALVWSVNPWGSYQLQFTESLTDVNWLDLGGPIKATGNLITLADPQSSGLQRFYRILPLW